MTEDTWASVCVLCAARGRDTRLQHGHCCAGCADRITRDLLAIGELATMAAASLVPTTSGAFTSPTFASRPPINLDAVDPAGALVVTNPADPNPPTVLQVLECWERLIRSSREMAPYGPASASRCVSATAHTPGTSNPSTGLTEPSGFRDQAFLTGVLTFLVQHVEWCASTPDFPLDDYADEIAQCRRVLQRWDTENATDRTWRVDCPADIDGATCGYGLRLVGEDVQRFFACPRCGTEWSVHRLMLVAAETSDAEMWLDADAIIERTGVTKSTLSRWVRDGRIRKWRGLYDARPILSASRVGA